MANFTDQLVFDVGFQLSLTATLGLMTLGSVFLRWFKIIPSIFRESLAETLSAIIFTLPVLIITFGHFNPFALFPNALILWLIPFIMIQSWIWYWFIIEEFDITIIGAYFLNINSYITILTLLGVNLAAAILGAVAREKYNAFIMRTKKIEV